MKKINKISVFIFRNDLRLEDNTGLIEALKNSEEVIPIFIFNKKQISKNNEYRSLNSMQFIKNSLINLDLDLKKMGSQLYLFYDRIDHVLKKLKEDLKIDAVYLNKDYTPFSRIRDKQIKEFCEKNLIHFNSFEDKLLNEPKNVLKENGKPYSIFTPFFRKNSLLPVNIPINNTFSNYYNLKMNFSLKKFPKEFDYENLNIFVNGGRNEALNIIKEHLLGLDNYSSIRDYPELIGTSKLSAHLKFGTISIRELYYSIKDILGDEHPLIRQLYWRDFFYSICYFFPKVFKTSFHEKYEKIEWENDNKKFEAWKLGKTGFPIVDAGMRELNKTGYMHNRVRMITSSFLVKDLHIDWKKGERYFATKLVDYDPCLNNGNWQWAASTGCDAQPYFRIFNPWRQQIRFDENCNYIKKWIPELKEFSNKEIHNLYKNNLNIKDYPNPIVDHDIESRIAKEVYKSC